MKINNNFKKELSDQTINERLFDILDKKGVKPVDLSRGTGIAPNTISNWKTLKTNPSADKIPRICEFLGVSCEYLLTGIDITNERDDTMLNSDAQLILDLTRQLNDKGVQRTIGFMLNMVTMPDFQSEYGARTGRA